jgi:hypothetical protein
MSRPDEGSPLALARLEAARQKSLRAIPQALVVLSVGVVVCFLVRHRPVLAALCRFSLIGIPMLFLLGEVANIALCTRRILRLRRSQPPADKAQAGKVPP